MCDHASIQYALLIVLHMYASVHVDVASYQADAAMISDKLAKRRAAESRDYSYYYGTT